MTRRLRLHLQEHGQMGHAMYVTPGVVVDGELVTTDLVDINLEIRILLGSSYYDDWENDEIFVRTDPLGNQWTSGIPGIKRLTPDHRSGISRATIRG